MNVCLVMMFAKRLFCSRSAPVQSVYKKIKPGFESGREREGVCVCERERAEENERVREREREGETIPTLTGMAARAQHTVLIPYTTTAPQPPGNPPK